jgi:hypothetical protein
LVDIDGMVNDIVLSRNFKTATVYKHQPVTTTMLVKVYIKYFRQDSPGVDTVFVTARGTPVQQGYINKGKCDVCIVYDIDSYDIMD